MAIPTRCPIVQQTAKCSEFRERCVITITCANMSTRHDALRSFFFGTQHFPSDQLIMSESTSALATREEVEASREKRLERVKARMRDRGGFVRSHLTYTNIAFKLYN